MMEEYRPKPLDTENVKVPCELDALSEMLARNVHEVWAAGRMAEGWTYGDKIDEVRKCHPCIVPYEMLPESERDYDRRTSMETLKFILKSGFKIIKL